jgi:hypothetical protein
VTAVPVEAPASIPVYIQAPGSQTPPLLFNPDPAWTLRRLSRLGLRSLGATIEGEPAIWNLRDRRRLDLDGSVADAGLRPYDVVVVTAEGLDGP